MFPEDVALGLIGLLTRGQGFSIQPSLINLNVENLDASILRVDNLSIKIENRLGGENRDASLPLSNEDRSGKRVPPKITAAKPSDEGNESAAPARYRLEPHLIFDDRTAELGEFEIVHRLKAIVVQNADSVEFTLFDAARTRQKIYVNPEECAKPVALDLGGGCICFNRRQYVHWNVGGKRLRWSFRKLHLNKPNSLNTKGEATAADAMLVTVSKDFYEAAWLLTRQDLRKDAMHLQHYLLLCKGSIGDENAK